MMMKVNHINTKTLRIWNELRGGHVNGEFVYDKIGCTHVDCSYFEQRHCDKCIFYKNKPQSLKQLKHDGLLIEITKNDLIEDEINNAINTLKYHNII